MGIARDGLKAIKNFGEERAWAYPGTAQIFWVPPIMSGIGKATLNFVCTFTRSIKTKAHEKILGKVAVDIVTES